MKKFQLNKEASDGSYYAIQEILVKKEKSEKLRLKFEDHLSSKSLPVYYELKLVYEEIFPKEHRGNLSPVEAYIFRRVRDYCYHERRIIHRLYKGMRTMYLSAVKCGDINKASFIIRSGPKKKDALVCPWCIKEKRKNYRDCFKLTPFWLQNTIFTTIKTTKGLRFLYVHRCEYTHKLFIVERPDYRLSKSEFYNRCPHCEAGKDKLFQLDFYNDYTIFGCATCNLVFAVGDTLRSSSWELKQSNRVKTKLKSGMYEKRIYDFRPLDPEYY